MTLLKIKQQPLLNDNFNNTLQNFFTPLSSLYRDDVERVSKVFIPVNITESEKKFSLEIIAPGLAKEDFEINLDKNILTISGEKKKDENTDQKTIRSEYKYSSFKRSFTLTKEIDGEAISAEYVNGVLVLSLPKKPEVKTLAKQISIN